MSTAEFFRSLPLFEGFTDSQLEAVASCCRSMHTPAGGTIFEAGQRSTGAYIVVKGQVEVTLPLPGGHPREIATLGAGEIFGEISLLSPGKRAMGVHATQDTDLLHLEQLGFDALKAQQDPAAYRLIRTVGLTACERLRSTNHMIEQLWGGETAPVGLEPQATPISAWSRLRRLFGGA